MPHDVFISYARDASRPHAEALHKAFGGNTAFLDTDAIALGERFPEVLIDALFDAKVVVIFAEPVYFSRWYCLLEFRIARTPFLRVVERPGVSPAEKEAALRGLVVAMPPRGVDPMMERFPPLVRARNWPDVTDIDRITELVLAELAADPPPLRERYATAADADAARTLLLEATRLPPPLRVGKIPFVPTIGLPPSIGEAFVGRADDLWRVHDVLTTESGAASTAGLTGALEAMGGFGKTRLALEYLYRFGIRHFPAGLFWIDAEQEAEPQLYDVLTILDPGAPAIDVLRQIPGGVRAALTRAIRKLEGAPPLFIIDNVPENPTQALDTWCPVLGDVPVLTTSRRQVSLESGGSIVSLSIDTLDPEAAMLLLTSGIDRSQLADAEWAEITEWVGNLPLALELLNRLLKSRAWPARSMLEKSRAERPSEALDHGMDSIRGSVPAGALRGITEAFNESYERLTPEQQYAARLVAWMAPAPIPEFMIKALGPEAFPDDVRATLSTRSFVTEVRDGSGAYFGSMHRVLADFVLSQSSAVEEEFALLSSYLLALLNAVAGKGDIGPRWVQDCFPLISAVLGHRYSLLHNVPDSSDVYEFANKAGIVLASWGRAELAGALFSNLSVQSAHWLGEEHPTTLFSKNNHANTLRDSGDHAGAQELQERVLDAMRRIRGEEHPDTLSAMANLAETLRVRGDHAGAQDLQERVLEARRRILGEEHPDTLSSMNNLANTLNERGNHAGAQELEAGVLKTRHRIQGAEHPDTLASMNNLAETLRVSGDHAGAQDLLEHALAAMRRIWGEEHPSTLASKNNLANTLGARGDYASAQELQEQVLEVRRRTMGEEHPDTLASMNNLAGILSERGDHAKAQDLLEHVLKATRQFLGEDHPHTLGSMSNLALRLRDRGDDAGARELQYHVLEARRRILGEEHPDTLTSMNNLANTLRDLGDYANAQELQERVVEVRRRILGEDHPDTLRSMNNLANTLSVRGDHVGAQGLQEQALGGIRRRLGVEHPWTTVTAWRLLHSYLAQGDILSGDRVVHDNLLWLLERDPDSLVGQQLQIRAILAKVIEFSSPENEPGDAGES